jgi:hypothetical protein
MPVVLPGPAVLRMRTRDTPQLPPGMRLVAMGNSRAYIEVEPERRGNGEPVPLAAVVLLRVDDSGGIRVERADAATAIRDMWALAFRIPDTEDRARTFAQLADLTSAVPVYNLYRPLTFETLPDVVRRVVELCES